MAGKKRQKIPFDPLTATELLAPYHITAADRRAVDRAIARARRIIAERDAQKRSRKVRSEPDR